MIAATAIVQSLLSLQMTGFSLRGTIFFNNPNQLGYFSLLTASILFLNLRYLNYYRILTILGIAASFYMSLLSLSKAAMLGLGLLYLLHLIQKPLRMIFFIFILCLTYCILVETPFIIDLYNSPILLNAINRIQDIGHSGDDSLQGRGFDRIINHSNYLLFGAGEGVYDRFDSYISGELHSTWGTLLFSYGIFGFLLYLFGLIKIVKTSGASAGLYLLPSIFYGFTHQGLRFTSFWILLSVIFVIRMSINKPTKM
ncbi:MAG: hypothetical protein ACOX5R_07180 [bacterium]